MNEEIKVQAINIDEISDIGQVLPDGRYVARLSAVNPREGKDGGTGMVEAVFDVIEPREQEGMEIRMWFPLKITRSAKNNKLYAPGISEMKQSFAAIGTPLPPGFAFPTDPVQACKVFGSLLHPTKVPKVDIALVPDSYTDQKTGEKKNIQRKKILGRTGANAAAFASAGTNGMGGAGVAPQALPSNVPAAAAASPAGAPQSSGNILDGLNLA